MTLRNAASDRSPRHGDPTLRAIIAYKLARGGAVIAAAAFLAVLAATSHAAALDRIAHLVRHHVTSGWSIALADALISAVAPRHLPIAVAALAIDGVYTAFEGWALHRRKSWAPWLVVVATAALLPFELIALVRRVDVVRALILALNVAIALYLVLRARRHPRRAG